MSVFNKLWDVFWFAKNLTVSSAELDFPDDDPQLAYFRWIDFAEVVCDFDDVKRFDALGDWGVLSGHNAGLEDGKRAHEYAVKKGLFVGYAESML